MDWIFQPLKDQYPGMLYVYMDDILVATPNNPQLHEEIVHQVLDLLERESFFLKPSKCQFEQKSIDYLGICVEKGTIHINPTKRNGLADWPWELRTVKQV